LPVGLSLDQHFFLALLEIIWINILLSGDNAVAIALACRPLPPRQRRWGILLGSLAAVVLRIIFAVFVVYLLQVPYLKLVGSLLLFWIAIKLMMPEEQNEGGVAADSSTLFAAVRTVVIADAVMSLDNVIAIAAAANGDLVLLTIGLVISVPLIVYGSTLILAAIGRFPILITAGGALLGYVAAEVLITDPVLVDWVDHEAHFLHTVAPIVGAVAVVVVGLSLIRLTSTRRRHNAENMS
jgi:YjbE family integral membrane protein